jgi:copper(I)-binding protein
MPFPLPRRQFVVGAAALCVAPLSVRAHQYYARNFTLVHPWTLPTPPGQTEAVIRFRIEEVLEADRLIGASASCAEAAELRGPADADGTPVAFLEVPVGPRLEFSPGHGHVLLKGLKAPLTYDRSYPLTLVFEKSGSLALMLSMAAAD